jgi:hypothetical protein
MRVINLWDLRDVLGLTHYQVRTLVEAFNRGEPAYAWMNAVLVREGVKKPKVDAERFIEAYQNFRLREVNQEIERIRAKLADFAPQNAA